MTRIATAQYDISFLETWDAFEQKTAQWVKEAVDNGAEILLFPEYACMELASLFPKEIYSSLSGQLDALQGLLGKYLGLFSKLATEHNVHIQSGTYPVKHDNGEYRNNAYLFFPDGKVDFQEKLTMTRFENEQWHISRGYEIKTFDTRHGVIAINICYDSEFPIYARKQVELGANLILVPSCTDTEAGYYRVRIGSQARALENQCYVVQASLVGNAEWSEAVDINCGAAAVYAPVDKGFPSNGIVSIGEYNKVQWVYADIDTSAIAKVRMDGQVFNYKDWNKQYDCHTAI